MTPICARCATPATPGARFCEDCGARLDGIAPAPPDRVEIALTPNLAAVTDRGRVHLANDDAAALRVIPTPTAILMAICDGMSSSDAAGLAARTAADTAVKAAADALATGLNSAAALAHAVAEAHDAVAGLAWTQRRLDPPSTTLVLAAVIGARATIAWVGDSRAYHIDAMGEHPLTRDHSWLVEALASGATTEAAAKTDPRRHAITRYLGRADGNHAPTPVPGIATTELAEGDVLMLCSDGVWNDAEPFGTIIQSGSNALSIARALVDAANQNGGRDNSAAAVFRVPGGAPPRSPPGRAAPDPHSLA